MALRRAEAPSFKILRELYHWYPVWNRDQGACTRDTWEWPSFLDILPDPPPGGPMPLPVLDLDFWQQAVKRLQSHRAPD